MTLDDLIAAYNNGYWSRYEEQHRAGIRALVEALRDEIVPERMLISSQTVVHAADLRLFFRGILGDAGNEKAAGGPTREDGQDVQTSSLTPAADYSDLVKELTGWKPGTSDDSLRIVWLMQRAADAIETLVRERDEARAELSAMRAAKDEVSRG